MCFDISKRKLLIADAVNCLVSSHNAIYSPLERDQKTVAKGQHLLPSLQQSENQNYSSTVSYLKNIIPPNQRYITISNKSRYIEEEIRIIYRFSQA